MTEIVRRSSLWLELDPDPVFAVLHSPAEHSRREVAVLICPPFGWDEVCSYRGRRGWAEALAVAGYPTARIDLPGTGDSGGSPRDPDRLDAWIDSIAQSASWLRERTGCGQVAAIGIGLGGMLACSAVAAGAPVDHLVLWGVPARGRTVLRELRAQSAIIAGRHPEDWEGAEADRGGGLELAGFTMAGETAAALERLDLTSLSIPGQGRCALLLKRETAAPDTRLVEHLAGAGVAVTIGEGTGYDALMSPPQESRAPARAIERSREWLGEISAHARSIRPAVHRPAPSGSGVVSLGRITESAFDISYAGTELRAIVAEPADAIRSPLTAVLLNAGAMRRIGPNRMWVEAARRWAARGVPTVRVDLRGIGDADGEESGYVRNAGLYVPELIEQTREVIEHLAARDLPPRFALVGLCSGAHWALHAAAADPRVAALLTINLYPIFWTDDIVDEEETRHVISTLRGSGWRRLVRRDVTRADVVRALRSLGPTRVLAGSRAGAEERQRKDVEDVLDRLRHHDVQTLILLGNEEPLYDQFERQGQLAQLDRWPNLTLERIPSRDHSLRAGWLQREVQQRLDAALERALSDLPVVRA